MAAVAKGSNMEKLEQIDLTKLNVQQLQQLKMEFESVSTAFGGSVCVRMCECVSPNE